VDTTALRAEYDRIKTEATRLAGDLLDIPRRVVLLRNLYLDSGRNHAFSQIALHGALWAFRYFEVGGSVGRLIARRYFYNAAERAFRLDLLEQFAEGFRRVNRLVCIDTWTNYHFVGQYGRLPGAEEIVPPSLLDALNRVHDARKRDISLTPQEKRTVFEQSFHCEQEITVAPGVAETVKAFDCPFMLFLCLRPFVRFAYFPRWQYLFFRNFADKEERIEKGLRAYDYAERAGWDRVSDSMRAYRLMPPRFFEVPAACLADIRATLAPAADEGKSREGSPSP
jgi:hypothetical protein